MKKAIFFDLDDTLLNDRKSIQTAFDITCGELASANGLNAKAIEESVREKARNLYQTFPFYDFTLQIGINPFEGLWGDFGDPHHFKFREMGERISEYQLETWRQGLEPFGLNEEVALEAKERFREARRSSPFVYGETFAVLDALKREDFHLLLLTNGAPSLQLEKLTLTPELVPYFDHIVISGNIGYGKPDSFIFRHALHVMGVNTSEAVMVGDNLSTDILGATRIGMDSIWIDHGDGKVVEEAKPTYTVQRLKDILSFTNQWKTVLK
ncbi:MAG TPA: HAD family hydrolase [Chondromyces sp.]|nr:HAD family hydrolase [Chondromyces sp.]